MVKEAPGLPACPFPRWKPVAARHSTDACERGADALGPPSLDRCRRRAGKGDVRTFAFAQDHLLTRRAHRHRAAGDEHAKTVIARPCEEPRATYGYQGEGAAN